MKSFVRTERAVIHHWVAWNLVRGQFVAPDGEEFVRTYVESPGAAGVVAFISNSSGGDDVVMVRQYRASLHDMSLEIPAGMRDIEGEDPLITAQRELREEAGFEAQRWDPLGQMRQAPGLTDAAVQLFLARDLSPVDTERHGPEERFMTVERFAVDEAVAMIDSGEIDNAMAVVGILRGLRFVQRHP
ncbi:MAG: NUDIX domain-containing protein [Ilumatobacteraceae bacterium]